MKTVTVTLVAFAVTLLPSVARAENLRVPKDYDTIQEAIDAAQSGDTVVVSKGDYTESVVIDGKTDIRLRGKGKPTVSAAGTGAVLDIRDSSDVEVRGLRFLEGIGSEGSGIRVTDCSSVVIKQCIVEDNDDDGVSVESCDDVTVEKCRVYNNGDDGICFFEVTNGVVTRNLIDGVDEKGIEVGTNVGLSLDTEVSKNKVQNAGEDGIRISGSNVVVEKNRIQDAGESGVGMNNNMAFPITGAQILRNRLKNIGDDGILITGSGALVERNRVQQVDNSGIAVEGTGGHTICRNKVVGSADEGINFVPDADGNTVERNKVSKVGGDGFDVESSGNLFERNSAKQSDDNGFEVNASGNTFTMNKAAKNGGFDLYDDAGGNTYDKNKFKTEEIDGGT